jgi:hypothetical protein
VLKRITLVAVVAYVVVLSLNTYAVQHPGSPVRFAYSVGHWIVVPSLIVLGLVWLARLRPSKT